MLEWALRLYFVANVALLTILLVTLPLQRPGTVGYVVTVAAIAIVVPSVLLAGTVVYFDVDLPSPGGR